MKKKIYELVSKANIKGALAQLKNLTEIDAKTYSLIASQYELNERNNRMGVIDYREYNIIVNKTSLAILNLTDSLELEDHKVTLDILHSKIIKLSEGQALLLRQGYENFNLAFKAIENQNLLMTDLNRFIEENKVPVSKDWYDQSPKTKLKLALPFIIGKLETEYDLSEARIPKSLKDFVSIFIKK